MYSRIDMQTRAGWLGFTFDLRPFDLRVNVCRDPIMY